MLTFDDECIMRLLSFLTIDLLRLPLYIVLLYQRLFESRPGLKYLWSARGDSCTFGWKLAFNSQIDFWDSLVRLKLFSRWPLTPVSPKAAFELVLLPIWLKFRELFDLLYCIYLPMPISYDFATLSLSLLTFLISSSALLFQILPIWGLFISGSFTANS